MTSKPATPPRVDLGEWEYRIRPVDGLIFRYHVYLTQGWTRYGPDGYGWLRITYRGALRTATRELRRMQARERRKAARAAIIASHQEPRP